MPGTIWNPGRLERLIWNAGLERLGTMLTMLAFTLYNTTCTLASQVQINDLERLERFGTACFTGANERMIWNDAQAEVFLLNGLRQSNAL